MRSSDVKETEILRVEADDREIDSGVIDALQRWEGVKVEIKRLSVGDYCVDRGCVFERKTLLDFAASLVDGRLFRQAKRLAALPGSVALILEGPPGGLAACAVRREALQGALITLSVVFGLPVFRAHDAAETARLILYTGRQLRRLETAVCPRRGRRPKSPRRLQRHIVESLPGIGPARAEALLATFGSAAAVLAAEAEALRNVAGIGQKTAIAMRKILDLPWQDDAPPASDSGGIGA